MDRYAQQIRDYLDRETKYRTSLFCRGFIITDAKPDYTNYPFYGLWKQTKIGEYTAWVNPETNVYTCKKYGRSAMLIGHGYDSETGEINENRILEHILDADNSGDEDRYKAIDAITGVFVLLISEGKRIWAIQDCGGQKMLYYGLVDGSVVLTSMPQLAGDVFDLKRDEDVERLINTKGYFRGSGFLPGSLSPYRELTRLSANMSLDYQDGAFHITRVFPRTVRKECKSEEEKKKLIEDIYRIFTANISATVKKWSKVGLSLTGGVDSRATFACAKEHYQELCCYSYQSKTSEMFDADAAKEICRAVDVKHRLYTIPEDTAQIPDYEVLKAIIEHNTSHMCKILPNELRKFIWLREHNDFDVELKSDISEIGRAYYTRKYYKINIPRTLLPRHLTIGQGRYFFEPWAFKYADQAYASYMKETGLTGDVFEYPMHDIAYWEVRMSSWAATALTAQEFIHEITIPYNNRKLMDLFLSFPEKDRLQDLPHKWLTERGNPVVAGLDCSVKDSYFGKRRMLIETIYYLYATRLNTIRQKKLVAKQD